MNQNEDKRYDTYTLTHVHKHTYTHIYTHPHIHTHIYTHTYTHTHIQQKFFFQGELYIKWAYYVEATYIHIYTYVNS